MLALTVLAPRLVTWRKRLDMVPGVSESGIAAIEREGHNPVTARALPRPRTLVRIVPATMGVDASLLGAAELAFEPLLADPAMWSCGATPYRGSSPPSA